MFANRLKLFELFGFKVHVDASWILLAVLITWSLAAGYFPNAAPGMTAATYWWMGIAGLIGLAASIVVHEFAHSLVARRYDIPIKGITLFVFGGVAEMDEEPETAKGEALMAIAGPLMSVAVAAVFFVATQAAAAQLAAEHPLVVVLFYLAQINILLAIFNMLPAYPLDGGRVLRATLWAWKGDILWATRAASATGSVFAFLLMALGVYSFISGSFIAGIWWFLIGMFVRAAAVGSFRHQVARSTLAGEPVRRFMRRDPIGVPPELPVSQLVSDYFYRHYFKSFPVVADGRLIGSASIERVKGLDQSQWPLRTVGTVMDPVGAHNTVQEDEDAATALQRMQSTGRTRLYVVRGDRLVGVLALRDLMNYLSVRLDLEGERAARAGAAERGA